MAMSPWRAPARLGWAWVLLAACALAFLPAADGVAPAFVASRGVAFPNIPTKLIGPSYATLRVQLDSPGVVYYLATPQDDAGAVTDPLDDSPHVAVTDASTNERRAAPLPEEVRDGAVAFINATDADASNDANDTSAFGYAALVAGALDVPVADTIYTVNLTNLNPQNSNHVWVVAESLNGTLQRGVALLPFYTKKLPPAFAEIVGAGKTKTQTPFIKTGPTSMTLVSLLLEPGVVYLAVQPSHDQAPSSAQVKGKCGSFEDMTCFKPFPSSNVAYKVPVGCPVFNLTQATSYAAYAVVEGLGLQFHTFGDAPLSETPFVWHFITPDAVVPRGSVSVGTVTSAGFTISVTSSKNGIARYVVVRAGSSASPELTSPSFEEVLHGTGYGGETPLEAGFITVDGVNGNVTGSDAETGSLDAASGSVTIASLTTQTEYDVFVVFTDRGSFYLTALLGSVVNVLDPEFEATRAEAAAPRNVNATVLSVLGVVTT